MKLSVVICAYNEEKSIGRLLENIRQQKLPSEITDREVLVVTSGCTDKTVDVVKHRMTQDPGIKLIEEKTRLGKASALNKAFEVSSADYIALIPGDVKPANDALFNLLVPLRNKNVSAVSGNPMPDPERKAKGLARCLAGVTYGLWAGLMKRLNNSGEMAHCSGEFMAIRRDVKTTIPKECAADDSFIAVVARKKGVVKFVSNAVCYNILPSNIVDYVNQRRRWLFGHFQTKKITGAFPSVMDTVVLSKPRIALQVLAEYVNERPREVGYLLGAISVEVTVYLLSVVDHVFHHQHGVWPVIKSTKYV